MAAINILRAVDLKFVEIAPHVCVCTLDGVYKPELPLYLDLLLEKGNYDPVSSGFDVVYLHMPNSDTVLDMEKRLSRLLHMTFQRGEYVAIVHNIQNPTLLKALKGSGIDPLEGDRLLASINALLQV